MNKKSNNKIYVQKMAEITNYIRRKKYALFAVGESNIINIFSNCMEQIYTLRGHKEIINCLAAISIKSLASSSVDNSIKLWNTERKSLINILSAYSSKISTLCHVSPGVLVGGYWDGSLIIWEYNGDNLGEYIGINIRYRLNGHHSVIKGIIRVNDTQIISGEWNRVLRIWDIHKGTCTKIMSRKCSCIYDYLISMRGEVT